MAKGSLTVISGPMFSNKSGELIRLATVHRIAGRRVGLFKHSLSACNTGEIAVTRPG